LISRVDSRATMKINVGLLDFYWIAASLVLKLCDTASAKNIVETKIINATEVEESTPKDDTDDRIVGGSEVKPHSIPWQIGMVKKDSYISYKGGFSCGGTILCPKFIMSAGHCVNNLDPKDYMVLAGKHDLKADEPTSSSHNIKAFHRHPQFKDMGHYQRNDFAILELSDPITLRKEAKALFLPKPTDTEFGADTKFLVSGWGAMIAAILKNGGVSKVLNSVTLPWISDDDCKKAYAEPKVWDPNADPVLFTVSDANICAGVLGTGKIDACKGDSGGPLAWIDPKTDEVKLIGAVSYGFGCAMADSPGVYAELTFALDWIKKTIGNCNEETCKKGHCLTMDTLDRNTAKRFREITPY